MKSRVALIVTLISLALLALLFTYNCSKLADEANDELRRDLSIVCQLTGDISRNDTMEDRVRTLESLVLSEKAFKGLFDAEGKALYASDELYRQPDAEDLAEATTEHAVVYSRVDEKGNKLIAPDYACSNLDIPSIQFDVEQLAINEDCLIIDVGGASLQITLFSKGKIVTTQHVMLGTYSMVQILKMLETMPDKK